MSEAIVPDSEHRGLVARLPERMRDFAQLARFDRPIGWWLLFWPCAWGVWLAGGGLQWQLVLWLLLGAIAMRGAGCVYNDIVDADLDRQVARTASRPVASGRVSAKAAWLWLLVLCGVGLVVLLQLRWQAQLVALASLALVAAYPFMKRVTWWPQAWLGLVFTWGAPVGWTALQGDRLEVMAALYAGSIFWTGPVLANNRLWIASSEGEVLSASVTDGSVAPFTELKESVSLPPIVAGNTLYILDDGGRITAWR